MRKFLSLVLVLCGLTPPGLALAQSAGGGPAYTPPQMLWNLSGTWTKPQFHQAAIQSNGQGGIPYDGTNDSELLGILYTVNSTIGTWNFDPSVYTSGASAYTCIMQNPTITFAGCYYGEVSNTNPSAFGYGGYFISRQAVNGSVANFGVLAVGYTFPGATSGEAAAIYININNASDPTQGNFSEAAEVSNFGSTKTTQEAIEILTQAPGVVAYETALLFGNNSDPSQALVNWAYIADNTQQSTAANFGVAPRGIFWKTTTFTTDEYDGPTFLIGPTVASANSKISVTGSASGDPQVAPVGAGTTPATNANLDLAALGTGLIKAKALLALNALTVATLPACAAATANSMAVVTDATAVTYNTAPTGGGALHTPVFCNGTAWAMH